MRLLLFLAAAVFICAGCDEPPFVRHGAAAALKHLRYLSDTIGARPTGSDNEQTARDYIACQLASLGYRVETLDFSFESKGEVRSSANVIAEKPGLSKRVLFIGGHYDSVAVGRGACDNGSGIGLLLALAKRLRFAILPYTVRFIAFGAEEDGLFGSQDYTAQLSADEVANAIGMINFDTVAVGDYLYVYGGEGADGWMREQALEAAAALDIPLRTNPGLNPDYPAGTAGDWSDHAPFRKKGIPYLYFEATNWDIGELDGYMQTSAHGEIYHTDNDTISFIDNAYPGRMEQQLTDSLKILTCFLRAMRVPENIEKTPAPVRFIQRNGRPLASPRP